MAGPFSNDRDPGAALGPAPVSPPPGSAIAGDDPSPAHIEATEITAVWTDRHPGWLEFNRRVLAEATDPRTPLLERAKFLGIFTSNLDEFFMKRVALLRERLTPERLEMLAEIRDRLQPMLRRQAEYFRGELIPELASHGIHLRDWNALSDAQQAEASRYFDAEVSPALTPLVIHPSQTFPFFSNLSLSLAFRLRDTRTGETFDARIKVPGELPQWVRIFSGVSSGERVFVRLHEVIRENAHKVYSGMTLSAPTLFRLTRDAEVEVDDVSDRSVREVVQEQIRQRRFEPAVRLEFAERSDPHIREMLTTRFGLIEQDVYTMSGELDYSSLFEIAALDAPALRDEPWTPVVPPEIPPGADMFEAIRNGDILVHHPYESFHDSVERFIRCAAEDEATLAIKMTVYRVGDDTPFVRSLIKAAESGKQVACVIELKARFDEARNLHWAAELERAGAHVTVGGIDLKTHAKVALVVRKEGGRIRSYAHIGTGNYHVRTATLYSDVGLFTCDRAITSDVVKLFHHLTGHSAAPEFERLLVAPSNMRARFLALIAREVEHHRAGRPARIVAKMNQLEDPEVIAALCEASRAGLPIDLIVRGFSCLRPGIENFSETIRIRSVIGRFLEHSRIFYFANGAGDPLDGEFFIGSADWMFRNLSHRVEVVTPILERRLRARLWQILDVLLRDERQAWVMDAKGEYRQLTPSPDADEIASLGTNRVLMDAARRSA
jgi:polyphosphate kinase